MYPEDTHSPLDRAMEGLELTTAPWGSPPSLLGSSSQDMDSGQLVRLILILERKNGFSFPSLQSLSLTPVGTSFSSAQWP
jgi:hypothetical protein